MTFAFGIESIKSGLLVVVESTILWDLGEVTQIIAPKGDLQIPVIKDAYSGC